MGVRPDCGRICVTACVSAVCLRHVEPAPQNGYDKARTWRGHLKTFAICAILSLGTGIIFWLLALWLYRSNRNRRLKCPTCGSKMNRLNEEEDNNYLSDSQDFEEQLKTVDYDVWVCPTCGTIERFPYAEQQTKYSKCPACGTVAMRLVKDIITRPATTRHDGGGSEDIRVRVLPPSGAEKIPNT